MLNEEGLRAELKDAMLAKDRTRVRVLRAILAAAKNAAIEKKTPALEEPDVLDLGRGHVGEGGQDP